MFGNVAVAARYAQRAHGLKRVFIIDFDVHHGNGTHDAFYDDPDIYFLSTHQVSRCICMLQSVNGSALLIYYMKHGYIFMLVFALNGGWKLSRNG